jgi:hypothetical protein
MLRIEIEIEDEKEKEKEKAKENWKEGKHQQFLSLLVSRRRFNFDETVPRVK